MAKRWRGRSLDAVLGDAGTPLHIQPAPVPAGPRERYRPPRASWVLNEGQGWMPNRAGIEQYRMTTDQAGALWPFVSSSALPATGTPMGYQLGAGSQFYFDPVGWTLAGSPVTNTAVVCCGHPGRGKSAITKAFAMRSIPFGYRALVLGDTKNEFDPLCRALGVEPFSVYAGGFERINPLEPGPLADGWASLDAEEQQRRLQLMKTRWLALLQSLVTSQKLAGRAVPYGPSEDDVLARVLDDLCGWDDNRRAVRIITIPQVWYALYEPSESLWQGCRYPSEQAFLDGTRLLRDALRSLVQGRLAGLFDAPTTVKIDWDAPIQSIGLAGLRPAGEEALAIALACINSWGTSYRMLPGRHRLTIDIRDELWLMLQLGAGAVNSVAADVRLSRASGSVQWLTTHQPADFTGGGSAGPEEARIGEAIMEMCGTKILLGQESGVAQELDQMLQLGPQAVNALTGWGMQGRGRAVWCIGKQMIRVMTNLTPDEQKLYYTNEALTRTGGETA